MTKETIIAAITLILILGGAICYIVRAKKRGVKCIGCPSAKSCGAQGHCTGGCSCNCKNK